MEYFYVYKTFTKGKWHNKKIIDILKENFNNKSETYFEDALAIGAITVNDKIVSTEYRMQFNDYFKHIVHQHEPKQPHIPTIYIDDEITVVNKPFGIPCHPVGAYHYYTVTKTIFKNKPVGCVNRLDIPVSGVLIINTCNQKRIHEYLLNSKKIYIAKVIGQFIFSDEQLHKLGIEKRISNGKSIIIVNKSLLLDPKTKKQKISDDGKFAETHFELVSYQNQYSMIKCYPITGRTHQIRVHLAYIGFPILYDTLYGSYPAYKFNSLYNCNTDISQFENQKLYKFVIKYCPGPQNRTCNIQNQYICLHAWKYIFNGKAFTAPLPSWAENLNYQ